MSRYRTRSRSALALLALSGLTAACGGSGATSVAANDNAAADEQDGTAGATLREADFPEYTDTKAAFTDIAKRIVGIDPKSPTGQIKYWGLQTLAEQLGYGWTWNSCNTNWDVTTPQGAVIITSNHQTGSGYSCDDGPKRDDPAKYTLKDWILADSTAVKKPYSTTELPSGGTQVRLTADGDVEVVSPIVVKADSNLNTTSQNVKLSIGVDQAVTLTDAVTRGWRNAEEAGVAVEASFTAGLPLVGQSTVKTTFSFKYTHEDNGSDTKTTTTTVTPKCSFEVTVPPGCHYKGELTVSKVNKVSRYTAYVVAKPQTAIISGFMRWGDSHACMRRGNKEGGGRDLNGHCERDHIDETFGGPATGMLFNEDIQRQRTNDSGNWYWHLMSGISDYQAGGAPAVDAIISNVSDDRAYQFSLPFVTSHEDVTECNLSLKVAPDSTGACSAPAPASAPAK